MSDNEVMSGLAMWCAPIFLKVQVNQMGGGR